MMTLDMKTVIFIYLLSNIIVTLVLLPFWLQNRNRFNGIDLWLADYVIQTISLVLMFIGHVTDNIFATFLGAPLFLSGIIAIYIGLERFAGKKIPQVQNYILLGLSIIIHGYFTFIKPSFTGRSINLFIMCMILSLQISYYLAFKVDKEFRQITRNSAYVFLGFFIVSFLRVLNVIFMNRGNDLPTSGLIPALLMLAATVLVFLLTFSLITMINRMLIKKATEDANERDELVKRLSSEIAERSRAEISLNLNTLRTRDLLKMQEMYSYPRSEIMSYTIEASIEATQSRFSFIGLMDEAELVMTIHKWSKETMAQCSIMDKPMHFPIAESGVWGDCVRQRKPVIINNYEAAWPTKKGHPEGHIPITRFMAVPIFDNKKIVAVGAVANKETDYTQDDVDSLTAIANKMWEMFRRKMADESLRQTNDYLENLFNYANAPIIVWNPEFRVTRFNQASETLTGRKSADVIGKSIEILFPNDQAEKNMNLIRRTFSGERWEAVEIPISRTDGTVRTVLWNSATIYDSDKKTPVAAIAQGQDITDSKEAEAQRLDLQKQLFKAQKLESIGILAGGVAHDFNNMLLVIMGSLELTMLGLPQDSKLVSNIKRAIETCTRAADLTRQLLAYSGQGKYVVEKISLSSVVKDNISLFESSIPRNIRMISKLDKNLPYIEADRSQVQQVIMNLILNAAEAIGDNNGTVTLVSGAMRYDEKMLKNSVFDEKPKPGVYVFFEVTDTGCGMDEKTKEKMFEPFFSTKFTGRGLGLAAIHGILRNHGGNIFVQSSPGVGSTIRVLFPAAHQVKEETAEMPGVSSDKSVVSGTVLLVDDEENVRYITSEFLDQLGFGVLVAKGGEEALHIYQQHKDIIDIVLLDYLMPDLDGVATFEALRKMKPDCKVVLSSGYSEEEATRRFEGKGLSGFIQKPYKIDKLRVIIENAMK
ncbi:MAG TPA: GAF domain-containing protein [Desulfomonilia bacterium]